MNRRVPSRLLLCAAVFVTLMSACSKENQDVGAPPGSSGAEDVVTVFTVALLAGDGARACSLLDPAIQRTLRDKYSSDSCLDAVRKASDSLPSGDRSKLSDLKSAAIEMSGEGTATFTGAKAALLARSIGTASIVLQRKEEHWLIG